MPSATCVAPVGAMQHFAGMQTKRAWDTVGSEGCSAVNQPCFGWATPFGPPRASPLFLWTIKNGEGAWRLSLPPPLAVAVALEGAREPMAIAVAVTVLTRLARSSRLLAASSACVNDASDRDASRISKRCTESCISEPIERMGECVNE